jgi:transcriptional regulator with XRE-family HTH domain
VTNSPWTVKSHLRFCAVALERIVAENIKRTRIALGFSQEKLAARARLDRTYVSGVERAVRNPTLRIIEQIADALNTSASDLMRDPKQDQKKVSHRKR